MRAASCTFLLGLVLASSLASTAHAQDLEQPEVGYEDIIDAAVVEFTAGRWQEARALFLEAHSLHPNARTLRGIGMTSYELRDYPEAVRNLAASLVETERPLTAEQRTQVSTLLEQARAFIGRFMVPAAPAGARLYVDAIHVEIDPSWPESPAPIVLGVGEHTVEIRAISGAVATARILVRGRTDEPLDIDLAPLTPPPPAAHQEPAPPPPASVDATPFILLGVGLGVAAIGGLLFGLGYVDIGDVQAGGRDWVQLVDAYNRAPILTGVGGALLGLGLGAAAIGATWAIVGSSSGPTDTRSSLRVAFGPTSLSLGGDF